MERIEVVGFCVLGVECSTSTKVRAFRSSEAVGNLATQPRRYGHLSATDWIG